MNYYNEIDPKAAAWLRELISARLIPAGRVDTRSILEVKAHELTEYTQCHFFAGIGGWSLALALAGWPADRPVWTGSCPCQPFSAAGKQMGNSDSRHLFPAFRKLIARGRPATVFGEQVASNLGREWLARVRLEMASLGWPVRAADLCAAGVSSPTIRQRLFWMAGADSGQRRGLTDGEGCQSNGPKAGRLEGDSELKRGGSIDRLAGTDGGNAGTEGIQRSGEHGQQPQDGGACRVEHGASDRWEQRRPEPSERGAICGRGAGGLVHGQFPGLEGHAWDGPHRRESGWILTRKERPAAAASGPGRFWDAFDVALCTDGKARRIEPGSFGLAHGLPAELDVLWDSCVATVKEKVTSHAKETNTNAEQNLRALRDFIQPEAIQRRLAGSGHVSPHALLFSALRELSGKLGSVEHSQTQRVREEPEAGLREMQQDRDRQECAACSPSGFEYPQQLEDELTNIVRALPQDAAQYFFNGFPLTIGKTPGRVGLLRGYGNAIVPELAAVFIQACQEITN